MISNGKAVVEVDGKLHKAKESELKPSVYSDNDVADAYDHIMKVIPEEHRSGFIQWAGYDEDRNVFESSSTCFFRPLFSSNCSGGIC